MKTKRDSRVRKAFPDDKKSLAELHKVIYLYDKKKYEKALKKIEMLHKMCQSDNDMVMVRFWYAMCLYSLERYEEAIVVYDEILRFDALFLDAALFMGRAYFKTGRKDLALAVGRTAISKNPYSEDAYYELALYCIATDNLEEARERAERVLSFNPKTDAVSVLALYYAWNGKKTHAMQYFKRYKGKQKKLLRRWIDDICNQTIDRQMWDTSRIFELHELMQEKK